MPAYMIIEASITDRARFRAYAEANPPVVARYGGCYLAMGGEVEALEGDLGEAKVVVSRWPDMDAARRYWRSPEYAAVRPLREGTGSFRVLLVEGAEKETLA